jgi:dTDP-4-amino-4,6-dideoxy-D-galactose acyltransferase
LSTYNDRYLKYYKSKGLERKNMEDIPLKKIQTILLEGLPCTPMDFIRDISPVGDKKLYSEHLTREIEEENDLRFTYQFPNGDEVVVFAERLPWDSEFFGYNIAKLNGIFLLNPPYFRPYADYTPILQKLNKIARKKHIKYLFAHVDSRDLATLQALGKLGFSIIENRIYYYADVRDYHYKERYPTRLANSDDVESLGRAAIGAVNLYDRFHADPFLKAEDIDRLMYKWVEASVLNGFADAVIVPDFNNPESFSTIKFHKEKWADWKTNVSQIVLTAISSGYRGWFRKQLSEAHYLIKDQGAEYCYTVTQVTNKAIIWVCESLGYHFGRGEHILRIIF